jgi:hypothetical protein
MAKRQQNVELWTGDTRRLNVSIVNRRGAAQPLSGATFTYAVRDKPGGTLAFTAKTLGSGITVVSEAGGLIQVTIASADTTGLEERDYYHELEMVIGTNVATVFDGTFQVHKSVAGAGA